MQWRKVGAVVTAVAFMATFSGSTAYGRHRRGQPKSRLSRKGRVALSCPVDGARFVIDEGSPNAIEGVTPTKPIVVGPGTHTIKVTKKGYLPFADVFEISTGETTTVEVDLMLYSGRLRIEAGPAPVQVEVDGAFWGTAPVEKDISAGEHVVRLRRDGYADHVQRVVVRSGQLEALHLTLKPASAVAGAAEAVPFYKKWWFWTAVGAAVVVVTVPTALLARPKTVQARFDDVIPK